jgi:uncharacterized membrane-anchored protein
MQKEEILSDGKLILLRLAPVDPRSLMQGDYMELNYEISDDNISLSGLKRGFCVVTLDENGVGKKVRLQAKRTPLNKGEHLIEYHQADWRISIGAESFFFEEGQAEKFEKAKYGGVRVDAKGNSVLVGLYDSTYTQL